MHLEARQGCPVLCSYVRGVERNFLVLNQALYAEQLEALHELTSYVTKQITGAVDNDPTAQRLRAFYCLEVIYSHLLPQAVSRTNVFTIPDELATKTCFDRTWKGLTDLIEYLRSFADDAKILGVEIDLMGAQGADALLKTHLDRLKFVLTSLMKGVSLLRAQLKRETPELGPVGTILAECAKVVEETPDKQYKWALALTNISRENGFRPWDQ